MAYTPTEWKNKVVEKPRTYQFRQNADGTVTLIPAEGTVTEAGTPVNADNMNHIEQGIEEAQSAVDSLSGDGRTTETVKGNADAIAALADDFTAHKSEIVADLVNERASLLTDGVFSVSGGALAASANSPADLSVNVAAGAAIKNGYYIKSDAMANVPITANTSGYNRIDIIVLEVDADNKVTTIKDIAGTPSSSPTAPLPTSSQLKIAEVSVGNNVSVINQANITDKRVNVDLFDKQLAAKANKTQELAIAPTMLNSYTSSFSNMGYWKDTLGVVHLKGRIMAPATIGTAFNLPAGYRPATPLLFITAADNTYAQIQINSNGDVIEITGPANKWVSFDNITFRAEI